MLKARAPPMTELRLGPAQLGLLGFGRRCQRYGVRNASSSYGSEAHSAAKFSRIPRPQAGASESCGFKFVAYCPWLWLRLKLRSELQRSAIGSGSPPRFPLHGPFAARTRGLEEAGPDRRCQWCLPVLTGSEDAACLGPGSIPPSGGHLPVSGEPEGARGSVSCSLAPFRWAPPPGEGGSLFPGPHAGRFHC
jgi:hypothetical protein